MCYIPINNHTAGVVWNATVYMKDGSHKKWHLTKYDAAHLYKLWSKPALFRTDIFNEISLARVLKISLRSLFDKSDDFVLS